MSKTATVKASLKDSEPSLNSLLEGVLLSIREGMKELLGVKEPKKKHVSMTKRELLKYKQKGKCAGCKRSFEEMGVNPILHHIGKSNRIDALQLLCPNCHSKAHIWETNTIMTMSGERKEKVLHRRRMGV